MSLCLSEMSNPLIFTEVSVGEFYRYCT